MEIIGQIQTDFASKFGVPRQSGLIDELTGVIIFKKKYRNPDAFRGLDGFSHIWILWQFSKAMKEEWSATVRPPKLGGNTRMGVFATRSPYRPNPIGMSCVKLDRIEFDEKCGPKLHVSGIDLMDGTPIYDIKPYLPYADSFPNATAGFTSQIDLEQLEVIIDDKWLEIVPLEKRQALIRVLAMDPRPTYQDDAKRIYGFGFAGVEVKFRVEGNTLYVVEIVRQTF